MAHGHPGLSRGDAAVTAVGRLAIVALGLSAGATLAEGAVLVPFWRSLSPELFLRWYAEHAELLLHFYGPLEVVSALLVVAAAALHGYRRRPAWRLLVVSALLTAGVLAVFPLYFQEVNASFATGVIPLDRVGPELARWAAWHWFRVALGVAAFATAVVALTQPDDCG